MSTNRKSFRMNESERRYRRFSTEFKRRKVKEIEQGKTTISQLSQAYEVTDTAIYQWMKKYANKEKPERTIVESKSDTTKILALEKKVAELERLLGQKQIHLEFQEKMIEIAEKEYGVDIKKKYGTKR